MHDLAAFMLRFFFACVGIIAIAFSIYLYLTGYSDYHFIFAAFIFGLAFAGTCSWFIYKDFALISLQKELSADGLILETDLQEVIVNHSISINNRSPFQIVTQYYEKSTDTVFIFTSADVWYNPTNFVTGRKVPVYVDKKNYKRYFVDISFLPQNYQ